MEITGGTFGYIKIVCKAYVTYSDRLWNAKYDSCFYLSLKFHCFNNSSLLDECARESLKKSCLSLSVEAFKKPDCTHGHGVTPLSPLVMVSN